MGVDNTAFEAHSEEWTTACSSQDLTDVPRCFDVDGAPVIVLRHRGEPVGLGGRCPHRGAPMAEGRVDRDSIVCPSHASRFRILDGSVEQGPSASPLPAYECRVRGDVVEVRTRP